MSLFFEKVAIIGIGLMGGSVGLALKSRGMCGKIVGVGRSRSSIKEGLEAGAIDEAVFDLSEAAAGSDLVVVCTPVGSVAGIIEEMQSSLDDDCIITDVGSTKGGIANAVGELLRVGPRFVGSHPLAGSEKKGVRYASADLFEGATVFMTPTAITDPDVADSVRETWESLGGRVVELEPDAHDRIVARTSHLPHIMASLLVTGLRSLEKENGSLVGKGFLDTTRIAASDPEMWTDICLNNTEEIRAALAALKNDIDEFDLYLSEGEYERLFEFFRSVKILREALGREDRDE